MSIHIYNTAGNYSRKYKRKSYHIDGYAMTIYTNRAAGRAFPTVYPSSFRYFPIEYNPMF